MRKFIVAFAVVAMMAGSAYGAEWNFYGSARVQTFWADTDTIDGADGDTNIQDMSMGNARIGSSVKVSDELTGRFEGGYFTENDSGNDAGKLRLLYGTWDFGSGSLTVGKDYTPLDIGTSEQVYDDDGFGFGGLGNIDGGRAPQLKVNFGGFEFAVVDPDKDFIGAADTNQTLPTLAMSYTMDIQGVNITLSAGYNTFEIDNDVNNPKVDAFVLGLGVSADLGAFTLGGTVHSGENPGNLINVETGSGRNGQAVYKGTDVLDNEVFGFTLNAGYTFNDMFAVHVGYGHIEEVGLCPGNEASAYYLNFPISLEYGVTITPEIGVEDQKETGEKDITYFGAQWRIDF